MTTVRSTKYLWQCIHLIQPIGFNLWMLLFFGLLATYYSQELDQFLHKSQRLCSITKQDFFQLFWAAFGKAFTTSNIESGWKVTGLYPFEPCVILDTFRTKINNGLSSNEPLPSHLTADNWRQVRKLLQDTITDVYDEQARLLTDTVINLMI